MSLVRNTWKSLLKSGFIQVYTKGIHLRCLRISKYEGPQQFSTSACSHLRVGKYRVTPRHEQDGIDKSWIMIYEYDDMHYFKYVSATAVVCVSVLFLFTVILLPNIQKDEQNEELSLEEYEEKKMLQDADNLNNMLIRLAIGFNLACVLMVLPRFIVRMYMHPNQKTCTAILTKNIMWYRHLTFNIEEATMNTSFYRYLFSLRIQSKNYISIDSKYINWKYRTLIFKSSEAI